MTSISVTQPHSEPGSNPLQRNAHKEPSERSLAASLRIIVRRVLRTNIGRTHFELRILDEARRLLESYGRDVTRHVLAKLVVDNLLRNRRGEPVACPAGGDWPGTQALVYDSTFVF